VRGVVQFLPSASDDQPDARRGGQGGGGSVESGAAVDGIGGDGSMTQDCQRRTRKPLLVNLAWAAALGLIVLPLLYVLSYAPAVRWCGPTSIVPDDGRYHAFYVPVDWLARNTPLARPLTWWNEVWGVEDAISRERYRQLYEELFGGNQDDDITL